MPMTLFERMSRLAAKAHQDEEPESEGVKCSLCGNHMTFGAASAAMRARHDESEMVGMMAILTGWKRDGDRWICSRHDRNPRGDESLASKEQPHE